MTTAISQISPYWQVACVADTLSYRKWCLGLSIVRSQFSDQVVQHPRILPSAAELHWCPHNTTCGEVCFGRDTAAPQAVRIIMKPSCQRKPQIGEQHSSIVILLLKHLEMQVIKMWDTTRIKPFRSNLESYIKGQLYKLVQIRLALSADLHRRGLNAKLPDTFIVRPY